MGTLYDVAVLPGDGTGPEVVREGRKVLEAAAGKFGFGFKFTDYDLGGDRYLATGDLLVTIEVAVPAKLSEAEREAVEALAAAATESPRAHLEELS